MAKQHVDGDDYTYTLTPAKEPTRQFDLRTEPERMFMWCASLERRFEDLQLRVAYLEMQMHRQVNTEKVQP